jgi:hypothetical protein
VKEIRNLYSSPNVVKDIKLTICEIHKEFKSENLNGLGKLKSRWEDNIKIDKKLICDMIYWIQQNQNLVKWWTDLNTIMDLFAL